MNDSIVAISEQDDLSLIDIGRIVVAGRYWVAAIAVLATVACATWAYVSPTVYRSSIVLAPVTTDRSLGGLSSALGQFGGLAALAGINVDTKDSRIEEALAVLQSREFIERFISDHNLLPVFFAKKWDSKNEHWSVSPSRVPTPWKGYRYFVEKIMSIDRDRKTGLITLSIDWQNRADAAAWANDIVERANAEMRVRALDAATASTRYLEDEREHTQLVETRAAINHLIESEIGKKMMATVTKEFAFKVIDRALPADVNDIWKPKRFLLVIVGVIGGLILGVIVVISRFGIRVALSDPGGPAHA